MKSGWNTKPLGELCDVIGGGTPPKDRPDYYGGDIPWATVRDMRTDIITSTEHSITAEAVKASATNIIPAGNVVIATRVGLGKVCLLAQNTAVNQDLRGIVPKSNKEIDVAFLFAWFKSISEKIIAEGTGATVQGVKLPFIKGLAVPIPEMEEQHRIVTLLDEAFADIATAKTNAEKNLQNARDFFAGQLQDVFDAGIDNWNSSTLGQVYDVRDGTHDSPKYHDEGFPLITSKNLKNEGLTFDDVKLISLEDYNKINERSAVHQGDVLLAMIGTIGNPTVVETIPNFAIKNVALLKVPENQNSYFLRYYLSCPSVITKMQAEAKGTTQKFVGLGYLRAFPINVPNLLEQDLMVGKLDELRAETNRLESIYRQKLTALDDLKKSLLHQAFSGQL